MGDVGWSPAEVLFCQDVIASYVDSPHFLARPWLVNDIENRLIEPSCRFVIVTAPPGAGKSTLIAELARRHPDWPVYFIRRDQRSAAHDAGVRGFLLQVGLQLAATRPELFEPNQVTLAVQQRIGTAAGDTVGAEIRRVLASPFYQQVIQVRQDVSNSQGRTIGVRIDELVADPAQLTRDQLQNMALLDPAAAARASSPDRPIVIMVDALDELRYHQSDEDLLWWLANLTVPPNVRFVLTTRPADISVSMVSAKNEAVVRRLEISVSDPRSQADALAYAKRLVHRRSVVPFIEDLEGTAQRLAQKADGLLGYLDAFGRVLESCADAGDAERVHTWLRLDEVPGELAGLYEFFLHQVRAHFSARALVVDDPSTGLPVLVDAWSVAARPALSVQAVAYEPLTLAQIHRLSRVPIDQADLAAVLDWFAPFFDEAHGRFRLFHTSMQEFLLDPARTQDPRTAWLAVDGPVWHRRICDVYWRDLQNAGEPADDYGLRRLAEHLLRAGDDRLPELISKSWMELRQRRDGGHFGGFLSDLHLAQTAAERSESLGELLRIQLVRAIIQTQVQNYSDDDLAVLTMLGRTEEALAHAHARRRPDSIIQGLAAILSALDWSEEVPADLLTEFEQTVEGLEDPQQRIVYRLVTADIRVKSGDPSGLLSLAALWQAALQLDAPTVRAKTLMLVALSMMELAHPDAAGALKEAVRSAVAVPDDAGHWFRASPELRQRDWLLRDLAISLVREGYLPQAEELARAIRSTGEPSGPQGRALLEIVAAQLGAGQMEAAESTARSIREEIARSAAFRLIARVRAASGESDEAIQTLNSITRGDVRRLAEQDLVVSFYIAGCDGEAEQFLARMDSPVERVAVLSSAAVALLVDENVPAQTIALLQRAQSEAEELNGDARGEALILLAAGWIWAEDMDLALSLLDQAFAGTPPVPSQRSGLFDETVWEGDYDHIGDEDPKLAALYEQVCDLEDGPGNLGERYGGIRIPSTLTRSKALRQFAEDLIEAGHLEPARRLLQAMDDPAEAAQLLRTIATAMASAGDPAAGDAWAAAEKALATPPPIEPVPAVIAALGGGLAATGSAVAARLLRCTGALIAADPDPARRDRSLLALCRAWCVAGEFRAGRDVLPQIDDQEAVRRAHRHLVVGLVEADRLEDAVETACLLEEDEWSDDCWWALGVARIRSGDIDRGLADLSHIRDRQAAVGAVVGATEALLAADRTDIAVRLLELTHWSADNLLREAWASVLAEAGNLESVCTSLLTTDPDDEAIAAVAARTARALDKRRTGRLLSAITDTDTSDGIRLLAAGAAAQARDLTSAMYWVDTIKDRATSALAKAYVAGVVVRHDPAYGTSLLKQAEKAAKRLAKPEKLYSRLILSWAMKTVDPDRSDALLAKVVSSLRTESDHPAGAQLGLILAMKLAELADPRALDLIENPETISLRPLVITLAESGCFDTALRAAQAEVIDHDRTFISLITALAKDNRIEQTRQALEQIIDPAASREAEQIICEVLTKTQRYIEAVQTLSGSVEDILLGFAHSLHHADNTNPEPFERALAHALDVTGWYDVDWSNALPAVLTAFESHDKT